MAKTTTTGATSQTYYPPESISSGVVFIGSLKHDFIFEDVALFVILVKKKGLDRTNVPFQNH
tara:strand:+ start:511 stop:696 length:186 start_codon:yes stop_codon:yes gene_type:complete